MKKITLNDPTSPLVSIIVPTLNNSRDIKQCLVAIKNQTYPNIELLIIDGYSKDNTVEIANEFGAKIIYNEKILAEPAIRLGISKSSGKFCTILATDNEFRASDSISKIVNFLENHTNISGVFPLHASNINDSFITKYINEFTDPFNHYLYQYASNIRTFKYVYKQIFNHNNFIVFDLKSNKQLPLLALAQGFTFNKSHINTFKDEGDDVLPLLDLIRSKYEVAFSYDTYLEHHTIKNVAQFVRKTRWATYNAINNKPYGISARLNTLTYGQRVLRILWPIYGTTILAPLIVSLYHFLLKRESYLWLFHAPLCFISSIASLYEVILYNAFPNYKRLSRK